MPFAGGYTFSSIPTEAAHKDAAFKLANFLLQPKIQAKMIADFGAFPSVDWKYLPTDLAAKYKNVASSVMPSFPGGPWSSALNDGWYSSVAPGISRN